MCLLNKIGAKRNKLKKAPSIVIFIPYAFESFPCISIPVCRGIQNNIGHHPCPEGISSLAVRRRHAHKQLFSSNAKNVVVKYQLCVLIKYKGLQQSPLLEEQEPELGQTLSSPSLQTVWSQFIYPHFHSASFSIKWRYGYQKGLL